MVNLVLFIEQNYNSCYEGQQKKKSRFKYIVQNLTLIYTSNANANDDFIGEILKLALYYFGIGLLE